jgi:hypothetical protein
MTAAMLVLEPIFEARIRSMAAISHRPNGRMHDQSEVSLSGR